MLLGRRGSPQPTMWYLLRFEVPDPTPSGLAAADLTVVECTYNVLNVASKNSATATASVLTTSWTSNLLQCHNIGVSPRHSAPLVAPFPAPGPGGPTAQQTQIINNAELCELWAVQPIEQQLRRARGRWVGHVPRSVTPIGRRCTLASSAVRQLQRPAPAVRQLQASSGGKATK